MINTVHALKSGVNFHILPRAFKQLSKKKGATTKDNEIKKSSLMGSCLKTGFARNFIFFLGMRSRVWICGMKKACS